MQEKTSQTSEILAQQATATFVLDWLASLGYTDAKVAGGAARDWALFKPARDIDIFVIDDCFIDEEGGFEEVIPKEFKPKNLTIKGSEAYTSNSNGIFGVYDIEVNNTNVQLILCSSHIYSNQLKKVCGGFPASISKIEWSPIDGFYITDEFTFSINNRVVLFDNTKNNSKSGKYLAKLKKKFQDYDFFVKRREPPFVRLKLLKKG